MKIIYIHWCFSGCNGWEMPFENEQSSMRMYKFGLAKSFPCKS